MISNLQAMVRKRWILLFFLLVFGIGGRSSASGQDIPAFSVYLPLTIRGAVQSVFGVEISSGTANYPEIWNLAQQSGMYWIRRNGLKWSDIQPNHKNEWNWQATAQLESELAQTDWLGNKTILVIRSTPGWAQKYAGMFCGPMKANNIPDFANFVKEAVKRYSAAPYFVEYYELWNEPDVAPALVPAQSPFGCWGDKTDAYYGGGYYAQMLSQVYPAIKSANPNAQVLIGGLLLSCDPTDPGPTSGCLTSDKKAPLFFEGILRNNGGTYFDIVNFHGYPLRQSAYTNPIILEKNHPAWRLRGGVVQGKINYLRQVMAKYGVNKPIFQSEAALLRTADHVDIASFERSKADYVAWLYARNLSEKLLGTIWYTLDGPGWYNSGLLDANQAPLPAYNAMKFAALKLTGANYSGPVNAYAGIEGFKFTKGAGQIWVVFSSDNSPHLLTPLPSGYSAVYDTLGNLIVPANDQVSVDHPVYIEFMP